MANSVDPDQTAPIEAVCSGSTLFASILNLSVMLGNYLQQTTLADDIFKCIFSFRQWDWIFLLFAFYRLFYVFGCSVLYWFSSRKVGLVLFWLICLVCRWRFWYSVHMLAGGWIILNNTNNASFKKMILCRVCHFVTFWYILVYYVCGFF